MCMHISFRRRARSLPSTSARRPPSRSERPFPSPSCDATVERPLRAPPSREAVRQDPAGQEVVELLLHEGRQRHAVRLPPGRLEKGVEVLVDHRVLGIARPVVAVAARHHRDIGALLPGLSRLRDKVESARGWAALQLRAPLSDARGRIISGSASLITRTLPPRHSRPARAEGEVSATTSRLVITAVPVRISPGQDATASGRESASPLRRSGLDTARWIVAWPATQILFGHAH
jgi:hypothetical protein